MTRKTIISVLTIITLIFLFGACVPVDQISEPVEEETGQDKAAIQQQVNMKMSFAQEHYKNKNYTEAIPLYREVITTLDPQNSTAYKYLAYSYIKIGDEQYVDSALTVFHTASDKYHDRKFPFSGLGYIFLTTGVYDSAAYYYSEAVSRDTTDSKNILSLSNLLINEKELDSALVLLELASRHDVDNSDIWKKLASLYSINKDYPNMVITYSNLHRIVPEEAEYLLELGQAYAHNGDDEKALEMLTTYVTNNPDDFMGYKYLGLVHSVKNNFSDATDNLLKAIELKNDDAKLHCDLATIYTESGKLSKARKCLSNAKKINKSFARIYVVQGDIVSKVAYGMVNPEGELDYCAKEKFELAYDTYKSALSDSHWGPIARRRMDAIKVYKPTGEEKAAWKHFGKSCD